MSTYNLIQDGESGLLVRTTLNELLTAANTGFTGVYYQINTDTFPSDSKSGDVLLVTQDGTSGSTVSQEWVYNGSGWTPISTSSTEVYYILSGGTFPTGSTTGDFTFVTNDGTSGGTVTQQYIYDGLQWKDFTITGGTGSCVTLPLYQQFGDQSTFLLAYEPLGAITVFNNGVQLPSSGYTLSGNSVTIDPSITNLDIRVLYFYTVCDVPSGTSGTSGIAGTSGSNGTSGSSGSSGTSGTSGVSGTSGLNGDKYRTSATGTYTLGDVSGGTLTITENYGYSVAQSILVVYDIDNYQTSSVVSYDDSTGELTFTGATALVGGGTYSAWTVNLAGAAGGDGSSGTSGTNGTSGISPSGSTLTYTFTGGTTWTINHNLGTLTPLVQAYKSDGNQIIPQTITVVNSNTVTITFSTNTAGRAVIASGMSGTSGTSGSGTSGTSGVGVPSGGTSNQILVKNSSTDFDTTWTSSPTLNSLTVTGTTNINTLTASTSTVNGNLTVTGTTSVRSLTSTASTVNGNLTVTGTTSLGSLSATTLNLATIGSGTSVTNLGITSSGTVVTGSTMVTPIYLSVNKTTAQLMPYQIEATVTGWTGTYVNNTPSAWVGSTGIWTCPRTGIYDISFGAVLDYVAPTDLNLREFAPIISHQFVGGGGTIYIGNYWALTTQSTRTPLTVVRTVVTVNQGDTIRPRIYQNLRDNTAVDIVGGRNLFIITELPGKIEK